MIVTNSSIGRRPLKYSVNIRQVRLTPETRQTDHPTRLINSPPVHGTYVPTIYRRNVLDVLHNLAHGGAKSTLGLINTLYVTVDWTWTDKLNDGANVVSNVNWMHRQPDIRSAPAKLVYGTTLRLPEVLFHLAPPTTQSPEFITTLRDDIAWLWSTPSFDYNTKGLAFH